MFGLFYFMQTKEYKDYIKSKEWKNVKLDILQQRGNYCEICREQRQVNILHLHHKTYKNLFNEKPEDLQLLCPTCHMKVHGLIKKDKPKKQKVNYDKPKLPRRNKRSSVAMVEERIKMGYYKTEHSKLNAMQMAYKRDKKYNIVNK